MYVIVIEENIKKCTKKRGKSEQAHDLHGNMWLKTKFFFVKDIKSCQFPKALTHISDP